MKIILLIAIAVISCYYSNAQISKITIGNIPLKENKVTPYDSLKNFVGENVYQYIGQTLYLNEKPDVLQKYNFYKEPFFEITNAKLTYKPSERGGSESDYNKLKGKYFEVIDVVQNPNREYSFQASHCLKLIEKESGDIVYHQYKVDGVTFDFIVLGYFEKLKQTHIGKNYVLIHSFFTNLKSVDTGKEIEGFKVGSKWKCLDVTIENGKSYSIICILENDEFGKVYTNVNMLDYDGKVFKEEQILLQEKQKKELEKQERERLCREKFGEEMSAIILAGNIKIGMTDEMCRWALGKPQTINTTTGDFGVYEQWVYGTGLYLYFDDGILTTIQN